MKEIKYIGIYDVITNSPPERTYSLAAVKKMNYIIGAINRIGKAVQIISIARNKKVSQKLAIRSGIEGKKENKLLLAPSLGSKHKVIAALGEVQARVWLFLWLLMNVRKNEKILVYHSQRFMNVVYFASKIKHFEYILEVEELYYKFGFVSNRQKKREKKIIMNACSLIVSTDNIRRELQYTRSTIILHGNYENISTGLIEKNGEYKVVFSGGIETIRNTAFNVCDCAEYLDECFKIYILGYGDENSICELKRKITAINRRVGRESIVYCGTKVGKEYDSFMQTSDIAINFQNMDEYYMEFAFPSKVLNYLNYGLLVVTTPLNTIRNSEIDKLVIYPKNMENTAKAFADTINQMKNQIGSSRFNIGEKIEELDRNFIAQLFTLLDEELED